MYQLEVAAYEVQGKVRLLATYRTKDPEQNAEAEEIRILSQVYTSFSNSSHEYILEWFAQIVPEICGKLAASQDAALWISE